MKTKKTTLKWTPKKGDAVWTSHPTQNTPKKVVIEDVYPDVWPIPVQYYVRPYSDMPAGSRYATKNVHKTRKQCYDYIVSLLTNEIERRREVIKSNKRVIKTFTSDLKNLLRHG